MRPASLVLRSAVDKLLGRHFLASRWCPASAHRQTIWTGPLQIPRWQSQKLYSRALASHRCFEPGAPSRSWIRKYAASQYPPKSSKDEDPGSILTRHAPPPATYGDKAQESRNAEGLATEERLKSSRLEGIAQAVERPSVNTEATGNVLSTGIPSSASAIQDPTHGLHEAGLNDASLPSQTASRRSVLVARFHASMERLLEKLAVASQRVNTYTGTDYSGIEALRESIKRLERSVQFHLQTVTRTKEEHAVALASQSASQKEVVQLLERKHSWSAADLERYMSLIRSEHINEQAVQSARQAMMEAERELEELRARLEKYERRQYHEEQIWSDTIRRNSTWVTFGLMGVNILLLLFSLIMVEPWRRKRLVREVKTALDERGITGSSGPVAAAADSPLPESATGGAEQKRVHVGPETNPNEEAPGKAQVGAGSTVVDAHDSPIKSLEATRGSELNSTAPGNKAATPIGQPVYHTANLQAAAAQTTNLPPPPSFTLWAGNWSSTFALWKACWADVFSDRRLILRRVDLTAAMLEGAAAGAACMGLLFVLLRPK